METQYSKNLKKGIKVEIITNRNKIAKGIIEDISVGRDFDEKGIIVRLKTGEIGRAQKILKEERKPGTDIEELIRKGESFSLEFKSNSLWSLNYTMDDIKQSKSYNLHTFKQNASKVIIAKSIAAFLNSEGGNLLIGVKEKKEEQGSFEIVGIEEDLLKLKNLGKDASSDGYKRMIIDDIIRPYFPSKLFNHLNDYLVIDFLKGQEKWICNIKIRKSDIRVFLNLEGRKIFVIRTDTENMQLEDEQLVDYCIKHWRS